MEPLRAMLADEGRDVFITNDGSLRAMCRRLRDEHNVPVTALPLEESSMPVARSGARAAP